MKIKNYNKKSIQNKLEPKMLRRNQNIDPFCSNVSKCKTQPTETVSRATRDP